MERATAELRIILLTGQSGAGKTLALKTLEDLEFFAIDNLPSSLLDPLILLLEQQREIKRVALVMDGRDPAFLRDGPAIVEGLRQRKHNVSLLFLEAREEVLIRRFAETRRPHPQGRDAPVAEGVRRERNQLAPLRACATRVIDTSSFTVHELRREVVSLTEQKPGDSLQLFVSSFGYKYGLPLEAAFIFDVRYLPNPFFVEALRNLTGQDQEVSEYVFAAPESGAVLSRIVDMMRTVLPLCHREGRSSLLLAIGCTGGQHRSVALAEEAARRLRDEGLELTVIHRDINRKLGKS